VRGEKLDGGEVLRVCCGESTDGGREENNYAWGPRKYLGGSVRGKVARRVGTESKIVDLLKATGPFETQRGERCRINPA